MSDDAKKALPPEFQQGAVATPGPKGGLVVLDLDARHAYVPVRIRGTECWLRRSGTLPPHDARRIIRFSQRVDELITKQEELTPEEDQELQRLPDKMVRLILDAPEKILKAIDDDARMVLIATFLRGA